MIFRTTIALLAAALLALVSHAAPADVSLPPVSLNGWLPSFAARYDSAGAPASAGSNYAAGDTITLSTAGGNCSTPPVLSVYTLSGSGIATFGVQNPGVCAVPPANPVAQATSSGGGSGATFTLKWGPIPYTQFENSVAQTVWLGPGAGSGITTGVSEIGIGYGACSGVTTGNENFCIGTLVGQSIGAGQFNLLLAGGTTIAGSSNTCVGVDSCRNATGTGLTTAVGTSSLKNQAVSGGNGQTAVGSNSMLNQNNANSSNDSSALGVNSCKGVAGTASFRQGTCLGADNGAALTSANTFTFVGRNIGNTTFSNGTDVLLLDSGNNNVDTPAGNSSHMATSPRSSPATPPGRRTPPSARSG
jgi:hypothetical protein